ncbi:MAG: hypothetical protein ABJB40_14435, partial [Acidobacteriota bacterium]
MRPIYVLIFLCAVSIAATAQKPDDILATATGHTFKVRDLSADTQKDVADVPANMPKARAALLEQLVSQRVLAAEAKTRGITVAKFVADEKAKVKDPTEAEIKQVTDANQDKLAALPPDKARKQVIAFLRNAPEQKALGDVFNALKVKFKVTPGKDVNAANLLPTDVLVTVNGQP